MIDQFSLIGEPRRPWIDPDELRARFLRLSAGLHPDRFHGAEAVTKAAAVQRYAELTTAFQTVGEPRARLLHLIELETGIRPRDIQRIPPGTMDLFVEVGQACREVDGFLAERGRVSSPMLKVKFFRQGLAWVETLRALQGKVSGQACALDAELRRLNDAWAAAPVVGTPARAEVLPVGRLEEIYRVLCYVARWTEQIQERVVQLAAG